MDRTIRTSAAQKVFYRPIEAAIRWSGLVRQEPFILKKLGKRRMPDLADFPRWPLLRLNAERIYDGLANGDLPYGKRGLTCSDPGLLDDPELTIRHVDLKSWFVRFYPDERPLFLFSEIERQVHPGIDVEAFQVLLADREALRVKVIDRGKRLQTLQDELRALRAAYEDRMQSDAGHGERSPRAETTYLNIVGGLLALLLGQSPAGHPYSTFRTQESVISALIAHHDGRLGISERTLQTKFAAARRHLAAR